MRLDWIRLDWIRLDWIRLDGTAQHCIALHSIARCRIAQRSTALHCVAQHHAASDEVACTAQEAGGESGPCPGRRIVSLLLAGGCSSAGPQAAALLELTLCAALPGSALIGD